MFSRSLGGSGIATRDGPIENEEQPKHALRQRSDFPKLLDEIILYTAPLVSQTLASLRSLAGLLAHSHILMMSSIASNGADGDDWEDLQEDRAKSLSERTEELRAVFSVLLGIRLQLDMDGRQALSMAQA